MSIIDELITDRTQADVDRQLELDAKWDPKLGYFGGPYEEYQEWLEGTKGTYRASDLNRVGEAMIYIANRLAEAGYDITVLPRTDWTVEDWVTPENLQELLAALRTLRSAFAQRSGTPSVPVYTDRLTYTEANDIEKILSAVDQLLSNLMADWFYSGEVYSGEV